MRSKIPENVQHFRGIAESVTIYADPWHFYHATIWTLLVLWWIEWGGTCNSFVVALRTPTITSISRRECARNRCRWSWGSYDVHLLCWWSCKLAINGTNASNNVFRKFTWCLGNMICNQSTQMFCNTMMSRHRFNLILQKWTMKLMHVIFLPTCSQVVASVNAYSWKIDSTSILIVNNCHNKLTDGLHATSNKDRPSLSKDYQYIR